MVTAPPLPHNVQPLRRSFFRDVRKGLAALANGDDPAPLTRVMDRMDRWIKTSQSTGVVDPRLDWLAWTAGDMVWSAPSDTHPLPHILMAPFVPVAIKARALDLTREIETLCPYWVEIDNQKRSYANIQPETWLMAADVPGIAGFVQEREGEAALKDRALEHPTRRGQLEAGWEQAWCNVLTAGPAFVQTMLKDPVVPTRLYGPNGRAAYEAQLFQAAMAHGWAHPALLESWPGTFHPGMRHHPASERVNRVLLNTNVSGSLLDALAVDGSGGLLDLWRATRPDASTWISPSTGTTLWRSLLAGDHPEMLAEWVLADPEAIDRPIPNGRWLPNEDGLGNQRRTFAETTMNDRDLEAALETIEDPREQKRLQDWWNDPAPTLRATVYALTVHLFPSATPFLERRDWYALAATLEGIDLRRTLSQDGASTDVPARSRQRL